MVLIDTNIILRHLTAEPANQAKKVSKLFAKCDQGKLKVLLETGVLAEVVYLLTGFYDFPRKEVSIKLETFVSSAGVVMEDKEVAIECLKNFSDSKFDFIDCFLAAKSKLQNIKIATFDKDFSRLKTAGLYEF